MNSCCRGQLDIQCLVQDLLRKPGEIDDPKNTFSLTSPISSGGYWPSKNDFLYAIDAKDNMNASPYHVPYPADGVPLTCGPGGGKYCGWNHKHIKENKGFFFYVIKELNDKGRFGQRPILDWEKQLLFAIAMQVQFFPIHMGEFVCALLVLARGHTQCNTVHLHWPAASHLFLLSLS